MSNSVIIEDGRGRGVSCGVTEDHEMEVISSPYPPLGSQKATPFRQYLTVDGLSSGSNDMVVDGSTTNVDFFISADDTEDIYITSLSFIVAYGTTGQPNEWADGTALTSGSHLFYETQAGRIDIHDGIKKNQDFFRLAFSLIPTAWEVRHVNANNDFGYFISMDLTKLGLPFGIKLDRTTNQRLVMCIKDNMTTSTDTFDCIAYGFRRFK